MLPPPSAKTRTTTYACTYFETHSQWVDIVIVTDDKDDAISEEYTRCPRHQLIGLHRRGLQVKVIAVHL